MVVREAIDHSAPFHQSSEPQQRRGDPSPRLAGRERLGRRSDGRAALKDRLNWGGEAPRQGESARGLARARVRAAGGRGATSETMPRGRRHGNAYEYPGKERLIRGPAHPTSTPVGAGSAAGVDGSHARAAGTIRSMGRGPRPRDRAGRVGDLSSWRRGRSRPSFPAPRIEPPHQGRRGGGSC